MTWLWWKMVSNSYNVLILTITTWILQLQSYPLWSENTGKRFKVLYMQNQVNVHVYESTTLFLWVESNDMFMSWKQVIYRKPVRSYYYSLAILHRSTCLFNNYFCSFMNTALSTSRVHYHRRDSLCFKDVGAASSSASSPASSSASSSAEDTRKGHWFWEGQYYH